MPVMVPLVEFMDNPWGRAVELKVCGMSPFVPKMMGVHGTSVVIVAFVCGGVNFGF